MFDSANAWIGILVALLSACLSSLGVNLQALGLEQERELIVSSTTPLFVPLDTEPNSSNPELFTDAVSETAPLLTTRPPRPELHVSIAPSPLTEIPPVSDKKSQSRVWIWYLGFGLYILCEMFGSVIALAFISPVLLAPLGAAGPIFNLVFSRLFLGAEISRKELLGTVLIVGGCAAVSFFGSTLPEGGHTIDDLIQNLSRPAVIAYFVVQISTLCLIFVVIKFLVYFLKTLMQAQEHGHKLVRHARLIIIASPMLAEERTPLARVDSQASSAKSILDQAASDRFPTLIGILYCVLGGGAASDTLLLTKTSVNLLITSIFESNNQFHSLISLVLLGLIVLTVIVQLYSLNSALYYQLPVLVVPLFYSIYTCLSVINTIVYLNQVVMESLDWVLLVGGLLFLLAGVALVTRSG